jgi:uncharacterized Fe-S radical SAM superfamily protein PflX
VNCALSTFLPKYLYSKTGDIQREYVHDPCLQLLLISLHFLNYNSVLSNLYNASEYLHVIHDTDIWLSILYAHLNDLHYVNYSYTLTWSKGKKFIETKSSRNKLRGFNL